MFNLSSWITSEQKIVEKALDSAMPAETVQPSLLHKAMRYSVFSGGKRIRPLLCRAAATSVTGSPDSALMPGIAIELLHTYTLIHDDLPSMDNDDLRRGKPTSHKVFGEANAILAGDALQTLAFEIIAQTTLAGSYPPNQLVMELASAGGSRGVIGGQVEDINFDKTQLSLDQVEFVHMHKTAILFRAAMRIGAISANASPTQLDSLSTYGTNIGLAFQITDDLLDNIKEHNELSCLAVYTPEAANDKARKLIATAISSISELNPLGVKPLTAIANFIIEREN